MWTVLGQAATVAQLVGADVGGLISMIIQAAVTAQQNKKECEQLARRVFTVGELLQHLQDPEVLRRPEIRRPLAGLDDALREAHKLVMACQDKSAVYRLVLSGRQAERFRDVQSRIDSYLLLFPVISHIDITRRLDRIYNILVPNDAAGPSSTPAFSMHQIAVQDSQNAPKIDWKEAHQVEVFTFKELVKATNNFAPDKKIGEGGFGSVYMGWLPDGREVAIKRREHGSDQGIEEFQAEVTILHSVSHKHIVRLFGSCVPQKFPVNIWKKQDEKQGDLSVVYEFLENRSLDIHLHGQPSPSPVTASWKMRIEILLGVSRAIEYLQSYAERPVIHRDVKPSNILLDASWAPRLTDFGLALTWEGPDHMECVRGTYGYAAPEYICTGALNLTSDVYSFGVVMLQLLTGKRSACFNELVKWEEGAKKDHFARYTLVELEREKQDNFASYGLVDLTVPLIEAGELWKVLDRRPAVKPTPRQLEAAELVAQAAVRCVRLQWEARPSISEVVATLETALELARCDG
ncbi:hypothetical protein SEVIR_8G137200v4 [Setaria viridis]|uniref:Protein kinase domain-containing protein n=2 Tax=Setaria TaxID=4554 RepID=K3ZI28_SETIT|nr:serine/threonine-protein kinase CDG1 [Setaria italica]XP_034606327.1 serine/threonine-protein kinase CDG1-like [Setaria viridis]RCV38284.1 hypothetical protein SETIT_8G129900v2 [Setaria italica]TKW00822.1 hypothetical protein SEVIR_8G137200v2 [Setaria viridis]